VLFGLSPEPIRFRHPLARLPFRFCGALLGLRAFALRRGDLLLRRRTFGVRARGVVLRLE
jgi:hypothetical protein